ncbi:hypothetical protein [Nocardia sp. NPDC057455]|uniref:hypothetical protein n=1 Tax=Nocardia sp. NPDC057455 TaxID=3346138 RepID=UPI0036709423
MNDTAAGNAADDLRPDGLGPRASALWDDMAFAGHPAWWAVLLGEACRLADRLDRLDALLVGDSYAWARLEFDDVDEAYDLRVDAAAAEARQTASALRLILAQLTPAGGRASKPQSPAGGDGRPPQEGGNTLADVLAGRWAGRQTGT